MAELSTAHAVLVAASEGIPKFLLVKNRKPLPAKKAQRLEQVQASLNHGESERVDWRKPKGTSWEVWDAFLQQEADRHRAASLERIAKMQAKREEKKKIKEAGRAAALESRAQQRAEAASRPKRGASGTGYKGHNAGSRKALVHERYDKAGAASATSYGRELGLKDGTVKSWIKSWA